MNRRLKEGREEGIWISGRGDILGASQVALVLSNPPASTGETSSIPRLEDPWRRKWQPTPVFLPGKPHGQKSLVGYSP